MLGGTLRVAGRLFALFLRIVTVSVVVVAFLIFTRDIRVIGTSCPFRRVCVVCTAAQREMQQESRGSDEGNDCSHCFRPKELPELFP